MNLFKAKLDTRQPNGVIATVTQFDNATLELQIVTDGQVSEAWDSPQFELIAMKRDANAVRETNQDRFTILSKEDHKVQVELKEQFLACRGTVKMQLIIKEGDRLSTTLFYLSIGQSLDHDIVDSHRDVAVLDELEAYIKQGFDDLAYQEQRMEAVEQSTNDLNDTMNANEEKRNKAEAIRQEVFDTNEANRTRTFNSQVEEQKTAFSNSQTQRDESFNQSQQNMTQEFEASQRAREGEFDASQKSNQNTFSDNESKRQTTFAQSQRTNQEEFDQMMEDSRQTFDAAELKRQQLFDANEQARGQNESRRVQNESQRAQAETQRAAAEVTRQQKMTQFEEKATQLSNDLDTQVARVDEFVTSNEGKLLGPNDKKDYMGNSRESVKEAMDANVDWLLGEINTVHYDGQHITAADSIEGHAKSAILSGKTLVNLLKPINNITIEANGTWITNNPKVINESMIKPSTTYTLITYVHNNTIADGNGYIVGVGGANQQSFLFSGNQVISPNQTGVFKLLMTTKSDTTLNRRLQQVMYNTSTQGSITFSQVLLEGDYTTADITYFEGMQSVKMPVLKATGKNLFDSNTEIVAGCGIDSDNGLPYNASQYGHSCSGFLRVKSNTTYTITQSHNKTWIFAYNKNKEYIGVVRTDVLSGWDFTTPNGTYYIRLDFDSMNVSEIVNGVQIEEGSTATPYEPYKSNILTVNEDVTLRSNGSVCDELDLLTGKLTQRIDEDGEILTQEVVKTVDLSDNHVYSYKGTTHYDCSSAEGSLVPTLSIDVPTNLPAVVTRQRATIQELEKENVALKNEIEETANSSVNGDLELMSSQFELDFRLFEIEMNLDMPMMATMRGVKSMAMTVYQQAKTLILAGKYEREDMEYKLNRYKAAGRITVEEYEELIALMDARELVD